MLMPIVPLVGDVPRTAVTVNLTTNAVGLTATRTTVQKFLAGAITQTGSKVKIKFRSSGVANAGVTDVFIGESATTGSAYNFNTGTATRITFGGSNGITLLAGQEMESDLVTFTIAGSKAYSVAMNLSLGGNKIRNDTWNQLRPVLPHQFRRRIQRN